MSDKKMTLYDVGMEGAIIADILTENEGELTPELERRIETLIRSGSDKLESAAMVVRQLEANEEICKKEAARLAERAKSFKNNAERLKKIMVVAVDLAFGGKVKTPRFSIWTQKSLDSVTFSLAEEFTVEMVREDYPDLVRTELSLDLSAIRRHYEQQQSLPEEQRVALPDAIHVEEKTGSRYLRIK
jgi:hypothetical protein